MDQNNESYIRPQWAYLNEIVKDFIELTNAIANYKAYKDTETTKALMTNLIALYMKVRKKLNSKTKKKDNKTVLLYGSLIKSMEEYLYSREQFTQNQLISNAQDLCFYIETTGITDIETDKEDVFQLYSKSFPT